MRNLEKSFKSGFTLIELLVVSWRQSCLHR
jgi:hypothetical protein